MPVRLIRSVARPVIIIAAVHTALALSVLPAQAMPTEGDPVSAGDACWRNVEGRIAFPGQRYGCDLAPEDRGPVMEFLEP
ncbi:MAG TPA: hypothetical protein VK402_08145 [Blastococcus sp.]|nr:hypothetical protein [Blastococcus sp.]